MRMMRIDGMRIERRYGEMIVAHAVMMVMMMNERREISTVVVVLALIEIVELGMISGQVKQTFDVGMRMMSEMLLCLLLLLLLLLMMMAVEGQGSIGVRMKITTGWGRLLWVQIVRRRRRGDHCSIDRRRERRVRRLRRRRMNTQEEMLMLFIRGIEGLLLLLLLLLQRVRRSGGVRMICVDWKWGRSR